MKVLLLSFLLLLGYSAQGAATKESIDDLIKQLDSPDFQTRQTASKKIKQTKISAERLSQLATQQKSPEVRARIRQIILALNPFKPIHHTDFKAIQAGGHEADGRKLYIIKSTFAGETYIGKYNPANKQIHIPFGKVEVQPPAKDTLVLTAKGQWVKNAKATTPLSLGKNNIGKKLYAARVSINRGVHIGMWTEGQKNCQVSWGGQTQEYETFEVFCE